MTRIKTVAALAVAAMLITAGGAAALSVDTETTNSAGTSDWTSSTVITEPHNNSIDQRIQIKGDSSTNTSTLANPETAFTLEMAVNDTGSAQDGTVLYETTKNWSVTTVSGAPDHYYANVTNTKWGNDLEYGALENVSVDARVTFNASESDESVTNITATVAPAGEDARIEGANNEITTGNNTGPFGISSFSFSLSSVSSLLGLSSSSGDSTTTPGAAQVTDTTSITNNTDTVTVDIAGTSAASSFSEVTGTTGFTTNAYASLNGSTVPLFVESADASWLDKSADTYGVISSNGNTVTFHNVNKTADAGSLEVTATGNEALGFWNARSLMNSYDAGTLTTLQTAISARDLNGQPEDIADVEV